MGRWQIWYGGNLSGKSVHRAPERGLRNTPFKTSRAGRAGLPRVWTSSAFTNNGAIKNHCSSVNSSPRAIREFYQTILGTTSKCKHEVFLSSLAQKSADEIEHLQNIIYALQLQAICHFLLSTKTNRQRQKLSSQV